MPLPLPLQIEPQLAPHSLGYLEHAVQAAEQLVARAGTRALALALDALDDITAQHPVTADDQAHLRSLASLYLLSQLENALLLPALELLAGLSISGGTRTDLGPAAARLMDFWRHRSEHFSAEERRNLFVRLFDDNFENLMINLCEALYKLDEGVLTPGATNPLQQMKVQTSAGQLAEHLLQHATSESLFVAEDILVTTRVAADIFNTPGVQHAFGTRTMWAAVEAVLRSAGGRVPDSALLVRRGKAGLTVLAWLADAHGVTHTSNRALVGLDHPVIEAAVEWLETSLAVEQNKSAEKDAAAGSRLKGGA